MPWVVWDENLGGVKQVFVSRLVGTGATAHFQIVNGGKPISSAAAARPEPTSRSRGTPRTSHGGRTSTDWKRVLGHFVNAANPTFVRDEADVPLTPTAQADVREPISSACTANPFNSDGEACQGGAVGTPFFLFTNGTSPRGLFAGAYFPGAPTTGAASGMTTSSATVAGSVNPLGASAKVFFQFGTTTAYGSRPSADDRSRQCAVSFSATISSLPSGTTIHYRAVVQTDFATRNGGDRTFTTS